MWQVMREVPRAGRASFVNDVMSRSIIEVLRLMSDDDENCGVLMEVMLMRDEVTLVHASMVGADRPPDFKCSAGSEAGVADRVGRL